MSRLIYAIPVGIWRRLPEAVRDFVRARPRLAAVKSAVRAGVARHAGHDDLYDAAYFRAVDEAAAPSVEIIADSIVRQFGPPTVLDVGCGTGALLASLRARGVRTIGLEHASAALAYCRARELDVRPFDIERDDAPDLGPVDVVVSLEVAEHLPERCADRFVALLCDAARVVVFTAAPPGQGGLDHVNEQVPQYWIEKFAARGFRLDDRLSRDWRAAWRAEGVAEWYAENLLVFTRAEPP